MHHLGRKLGLVVAALGLLMTVKPAHADFDITLRQGNFQDVRDLITLLQSHGFFKCDVADSWTSILNNAQSQSGSARQATLQFLLNCCLKPSRELRIVGGVAVPWTHNFTLEGVTADWPDLANFDHTTVAQVAGRCLCIGIRRLRDNTAGDFRVIVSGNSTAVECFPVD